MRKNSPSLNGTRASKVKVRGVDALLPLQNLPFKECGLVVDRDLNASLNILKKGLDEGLGRPGLPVEGRPLPRVVPYEAVIMGQVFLMKQEAPPERAG